MKKTTYTKSFTGWDTPKSTAAKVLKECRSIKPYDYLLRPYGSRAGCAIVEGEKPVRVRYTYTVTVEPVK